MEIKKSQEKVKEFDEARGWEDNWDLKDISLNICEEIGELWNLIKWIDKEEQKEVVEKNKEEVEDFIGDSFYLILKLANQIGIDVETSFTKSLEDFKKRFPEEKMLKHKHGNKNAGGIDDK